MRCSSSGSVVSRRSTRTVSVPNVKLGTNTPSITSTWMRSAPLSSRSCAASAMCPKSAASRLGAIRMASRQGVHVDRGIPRILADVVSVPGLPEFSEPSRLLARQRRRGTRPASRRWDGRARRARHLGRSRRAPRRLAAPVTMNPTAAAALMVGIGQRDSVERLVVGQAARRPAVGDLERRRAREE